jgi:aryl-alcohol dehydrogenase-like predicted oxidoreductase
MLHRTISGTDLSLSILGFGNFTFGVNWWGDFTDKQAVSIQNHAVDQGVTFFDTAPAYGNWRAEKLMKPTLQYAGRDNIVLSTKFGYDLTADPGEEGSHRERKQNFTPGNLRKELEKSLDNMGVDHIDLYQAHNIKLPHYTPELFEELEKFKTEGKIKEWGIALGPAIGWREEGHTAFLEHDAAVVQTVYNLYEQDLGREFGEIAEHRGRGGIIARVPTNSGMLDEEFKDEHHQFPPRDHRKFRDKAWLVYGLKKNAIVNEMAGDLGLTVQQFALRWLAHQPAMVSIEPNILSKQDVDTYIDACNGDPLPPEVTQKVAELYEDDWGLGEAAHPCDFKSSTAEGGSLRASYKPADLAGVGS